MMKKGRSDFIFPAILLCGLLLRLYNLGRYSFWLDETIVILLGPKNIWARLTDPAFKVPELSLVPLFSILVHFWKYLGKSEFILRLLPLVFGIISIIGIYMLAKLLFNKKIAQFSALILSLSPFHVYYSQELKYNTLIVSLTIFSVYFYIKSLRENRWIFWSAFIGFMLLDICAHFITVFLLISLNAHYLFHFNKYKKLIYRWLATQGIILFFLIPWIIRIVQQMAGPDPFSSLGWIQKPSLSTLFYSFQIFNTGYGASIFIGYSAVFLCLSLFVLGILSIAKEKEKLSLLLIWFLIPFSLIYAASLVVKPVFLHRTLIYVTPAYYIILACGFGRIKKKLVWMPLVLFTIPSFISMRNQFENVLPLSSILYPDRIKDGASLPLTSVYHPGVFEKSENKAAAEYIERNFQQGDVIGHIGFTTLIPFIYYHSDKFEEKCVGGMLPPNLLHHYLHSDPILQKRFSFIDIKQFIRGKKRIWIVVFAPSGLSGKDLKKIPEVDGFLTKNCNLIDSKVFPGIKINLFEIKSE